MAVFKINLAKITGRFYPDPRCVLGLIVGSSNLLPETCSHLLSYSRENLLQIVFPKYKFAQFGKAIVLKLFALFATKLKSAPPIATSSEYRTNGGSLYVALAIVEFQQSAVYAGIAQQTT